MFLWCVSISPPPSPPPGDSWDCYDAPSLSSLSPASSLLPIDFKCFIEGHKSAACSPEPSAGPVLALIKIENYKWKYSVSLLANKVFASSSTVDVLINIPLVVLSSAKYVSRPEVWCKQSSLRLAWPAPALLIKQIKARGWAHCSAILAMLQLRSFNGVKTVNIALPSLKG